MEKINLSYKDKILLGLFGAMLVGYFAGVSQRPKIYVQPVLFVEPENEIKTNPKKSKSKK